MKSYLSFNRSIDNNNNTIVSILLHLSLAQSLVDIQELPSCSLIIYMVNIYSNI